MDNNSRAPRNVRRHDGCYLNKNDQLSIQRICFGVYLTLAVSFLILNTMRSYNRTSDTIVDSADRIILTPYANHPSNLIRSTKTR